MASPAINKINAQNSTGPRSVEGKAVTRFNAMKHGLDAASLVIPGEDPAELVKRAEDYYRLYDPQGAVETDLVEILLRSGWFQIRYARLEAQIYQSLFKKLDDPNATIGDVYLYDASAGNVLDKLFRRQVAAARDFNKALAELRRVQKDRREQEMLQRWRSGRPRLRPPLPWMIPSLFPTDLGFVPNPSPAASERPSGATRTRPPQPLFDN